MLQNAHLQYSADIGPPYRFVVLGFFPSLVLLLKPYLSTRFAAEVVGFSEENYGVVDAVEFDVAAFAVHWILLVKDLT